MQLRPYRLWLHDPLGLRILRNIGFPVWREGGMGRVVSLSWCEWFLHRVGLVNGICFFPWP